MDFRDAAQVMPWFGKELSQWHVGGVAMGLLFEILGLWLVGSCILGPIMTWAFFWQNRIDREMEDIPIDRQRREHQRVLRVVA